MRAIQLIPLGSVDTGIVEYLSLILPDILDVPCAVRRLGISLEPSYNQQRNQYHSTQILAQLLPHAVDTDTKVLGVAHVDLYIPILTFVFGEAQLGRSCAVISDHRLHQEFFGLPEDQALLYERCEKEALHELGHTFGLRHCTNLECVMRPSNSVEAIDLKGGTFCSRCRSGIRWT